MSFSIRQAVLPAYLLLCLILGGSSGAGALGNMVVQLAGLGVIGWAIASGRRNASSPAERQLLWLALATLALFALQLVPMPPELWQHLPERQRIAAGYALLDQPAPWLPLSLAPHQTLAAATRLIPPLAVILVMLRIGRYDDRLIVWTVGAGAFLSVVVGVLQLSGGAGAPWHFYRTDMAGFFSNRNHLATLLVVAIPFAASLFQEPRDQRSRSRRLPFLPVALLAVLGVGLIVNPSLAGLLLLAPVAIATLLSFSKGLGRKSRWAILLFILIAAAIAFALARTPARDDAASKVAASAQPRTESIGNTIVAAGDYFPAGSGFGTFQEIYRTYEDPVSVSSVYINHAHNDYAEVALEGGLPGILLMLAFLGWWARQAFGALFGSDRPAAARAAAIATAAMLLHSLADYPLRTSALAAIFALSCVLMCRRETEQNPLPRDGR